MRPASACRRICRRVLIAFGAGLGLLLVDVASCSDQVLQAAFASVQDLALQLVQIGFDSLQFDWQQTTDGGTGTDQVTVRAVTDAPARSLT